MHVAKKVRKSSEQCYVCHEVKATSQFIALHRNRYWVCKECKSHLNRLTRFRITPDDYQKLLDHQGHRCAICESDLVQEKNQTVLDHCHETNEIRGILCRACNTGLGNFKDKNGLLANAAKYLINPPARNVVKPVDVKNRYEYVGKVMRAKRCNTSSNK